MTRPVLHFPAIPVDTVIAAESEYGPGNPYLWLGAHINELLTGLPRIASEYQLGGPSETAPFFTLLTICQFKEELTDRKMIAELRHRIDLKYALHLPLNYSLYEPERICIYRQRLYKDFSDRQTFQCLLDRLANGDWLGLSPAGSLTVLQILEVICFGNRIELVVETMLDALETLVVNDPEWLRQSMLPHWVERYSRRKPIPCWPNSCGKWQSLSLGIAADIYYLVEKVHRSHNQKLEGLVEIQTLEEVWKSQFELSEDDLSPAAQIHWRPYVCQLR